MSAAMPSLQPAGRSARLGRVAAVLTRIAVSVRSCRRCAPLRSPVVRRAASVRLFGWAPPLLFLLYRFPLRGLGGLLFYYLILSRLPLWKRLVHSFAGAAIDPRFHMIKHADFDTVNKRYLVCVHPHVRAPHTDGSGSRCSAGPWTQIRAALRSAAAVAAGEASSTLQPHLPTHCAFDPRSWFCEYSQSFLRRLHRRCADREARCSLAALELAALRCTVPIDRWAVLRV